MRSRVNSLQIAIISLPDAVERRASARAQMRAAGVAFEFFDALDAGQAIASRAVEGVDEHEWLLNCGRDVVPGEIGCFASHRALWRRAAETGVPILIMEDDFTLLDTFADAVAATDSVIGEAGFVRLQADLRARKVPVSDVGDFCLSRFTKPPHGCMAYAVSPAVAREWVAQTDVIDAPVDVFVKKYWDHRQPMFALLPYSVRPSNLSHSTSIPGRRRQRKPASVSVRRFLRKTGWHLQRHWWNLALSRGAAGTPGGNSASGHNAPATQGPR